jgi:hypothetical protein
MMMGGDRLVDGKKFNMGKWEDSQNQTAPAVDMIPKDIVVCPWHDGKRESCLSIPMFIEKGFRVLPAGWNKADATEALIRYAAQFDSPLMLGHLFTTWSRQKELTAFPPLVNGLELLKRLAGASPYLRGKVPYKTINETTLYLEVFPPPRAPEPLPAIVFFSAAAGWAGHHASSSPTVSTRRRGVWWRFQPSTASGIAPPLSASKMASRPFGMCGRMQRNGGSIPSGLPRGTEQTPVSAVSD